MKKLFVIILSVFVTTQVLSQSKETMEKIKELEGKIEEIIIKTDKEEIKIEGEEAEKILRKIKKKGFHFWKDDAGFEFKIDTDKIKKLNEKLIERYSCKKDTNLKEIKVEFEGDKKKVTVIDKKGEKKVYTGDAADDFLEEHLSENRFFHFKGHDFDFEGEDVFFFDTDKEYDDLIIELNNHDEDDVKIDIEIDENGEKVVTVTEEKDGEITKKKYTGEEAEKFLKEHNKIFKVKVKKLKDDLDKLKKKLKIKKRIIIEKEDE